MGLRRWRQQVTGGGREKQRRQEGVLVQEDDEIGEWGWPKAMSCRPGAVLQRPASHSLTHVGHHLRDVPDL